MLGEEVRAMKSHQPPHPSEGQGSLRRLDVDERHDCDCQPQLSAPLWDHGQGKRRTMHRWQQTRHQSQPWQTTLAGWRSARTAGGWVVGPYLRPNSRNILCGGECLHTLNNNSCLPPTPDAWGGPAANEEEKKR